MSADQEKLSQLVEKFDELLTVLKDVSKDMKTISKSMQSLAAGQITAPKPTAKPAAPPKPAPTPAPAPARAPAPEPRPAAPTPPPAATPASAPSGDNVQTVEDVRMMFSEEVDSLLDFEDKGDYVMIKPKQFLGSGNFGKIASTVRGAGGEYISAGRDSHFRVYKKK
ncbi:MAG: hypothetical protein NWF04_00670 [Candidatus Bathyarchaeota archaeon]|nr:hypothetical protein [Candidatus Bathyarchaeota archaeon]